MKNLYLFFILPVLALLQACTNEPATIYVRVHNMSASDYTNVQVDPTATGQAYIQIGTITAGGNTDYIQVDQSKAAPIIDVTCFYAQHHYSPDGQPHPQNNTAGFYTYHVNILDSGSTHYLVVTQTED